MPENSFRRRDVADNVLEPDARCRLHFAVERRVLLQERLLGGTRCPAEFKQAWSNNRKVSVADLVEEMIDASHSLRIKRIRVEAGHTHASNILTQRVERSASGFESYTGDAVRLEPRVSMLDHRRLHHPMMRTDSDLHCLDGAS